MSFLLDTDHLSVHLRQASGLAHRFMQHSGRLYTSSIALAELYVWAYRRPDPTAALASIQTMLFHEVSVVDYDNDCAQVFGRVRIELRRQGIEVPTLDLMIASVALVFDLTLVTHNTADFKNVPGLRLDDWVAP
ncbi:MAG: type II toxin-antitoxin system VapC family toxin [Planctomycetia bacterium]|nr:type II toxin-antitoxin system VapC family toxin [Planctomycetia bacterium]